MSTPLLAISGSLKSTSSNTSILRILQDLAPSDVHITIYDGLEQLPHFNPDKEAGNTEVARFRQLLKAAGGVIISTPEYAFGVPGVLKNALDWSVSSGELNEKPVIAISASPLYSGGDKALASLLLTLSALGANMDDQSSLSIRDIQNRIKGGELVHEETRARLTALLAHVLGKIQQRPGTDQLSARA